MKRIARRDLLTGAGMTMAGWAAPLPGLVGEAPTAQKLKIVVTGAHPDDPESGCGGTILRYTETGHAVTILYLTRGESGIPGTAMDEAACIRTEESLKACEILKAKAVFAGQIDGHTEVNETRYAEFHRLLEAENPDVVFTHWPVDKHRDHRAASLLTLDAWLQGGRKYDLYYYEVDLGRQSQIYHPTDYVDISTTIERKKAACWAHASQHPETDFWPMHDAMNRFRGMEGNLKFAEAFIRHCQNPGAEPPSPKPKVPAD
jgi:LmbE family N-acetylglucosaminyl deacetylase